MIDLSSNLPIAVRAWTERRKEKVKNGRWLGTTGRRPRRGRSSRFSHALVFDTETSLDAAQGLLFGAFRYCRIDWTPHPEVAVVAEGLIYADDLPGRDADAFARLQDYAASRKADVNLSYLAVEPNWELQLCSRTEFVDRWLYRVGYPNGNVSDP